MSLLSVLDQSPIRSGGTAADAVRETLELAAAAERLGYHRYWLAEHHSTPGLAGSTPEVLIGQVAARTRRIRVGAGGVMLSHYSPLKVAENFRMLETLFPGRIDLGIGRAPGTDQRTARALAHGAGTTGIEQFPDQVADLIGFLHNRLDPGHRFAGVRAMPEGSGAPELWLLGSSDQSAAIAAYFGTAFSFAHFINHEGGAQVTQAYAKQFHPSASLKVPRASVAAFVVCAETEAEASRLALSRDLFLLWLSTGRSGAYPSVEEAEAYPYTGRERALVEYNRQRTIAGAPEQVRARLLALGAEYGVDEFVIVTITHDFKARLRSYELLAGVFQLAARGG
ncbi:MAG TPA: LLM class flavin-dependent oxidoreductase [Candidatus Methylomirabilis sp.]